MTMQAAMVIWVTYVFAYQQCFNVEASLFPQGLSPSGGMLALAEQLQLQAYHCSLIVSCVYLLLLSNHEEGSSLTDHPAVQKVSHLLDSIVRGLNKKEWNEVESKNRHQLVAAILNNLMPMFSTVLCSDVPMETATKAATVSGLLAARVPKGLVDVVGQIAKGKVCVHT